MTAAGSISGAIAQCIDEIVQEHACQGRRVSLRGEMTRGAHAAMMGEPWVIMMMAAMATGQGPLLETGCVVCGVPFDLVTIPGVVAWQIRITEIV